MSSPTILSASLSSPVTKADPLTSIHLALIFDYHVTDSSLENGFDFVWGGSPMLPQPGIYRTVYEPFDRSGYQTLAWFQSMHPTWIVYQCDGVTPAWHNDGTGTDYVPVDTTNPEVVQFQVDTLSDSLANPANGYSGVAFDNVNLDNSMSNTGLGEKRCGTRDVNGVFHARWTDLSAYQQGVIQWASAVRTALQQKFPGTGVALNFSYDSRYPAESNQLLQAVDISIDEGGFTSYGSGYLTGAAWKTRLNVLSGLIDQGKRVVIINEVPAITPQQVQWVLASYLMIADPAADVFISRVQEYGSLPDWLRTLVQQNPTGAPMGPFVASQGLYSRQFANCVAVVNPDNATTFSITLGGNYRDLYGNTYSGSVTLGPHSGLVLFPV